ncbi:hypothetical protein KVR01_003558 [Diaporthe batatas]|uniref:uncharacterized protein n=1 Tax=Diaporthe batatas TaxID=748121 RepID=UPI001D056857|nr:uncharacterized protein KVR01_003558 [Diaporthe batatas]KAG8167869.1 hypothetical protein KVR01_003558 [Diaporthe batatas]
MFPNIIVQALKLVTVVEGWIPLPTPPFGESALSSGLIQLQTYNIHAAVSHHLSTLTAHMEAEIRMLRDLEAMANQHQNDYADFFELIESHRPLDDFESAARNFYQVLAESGRSAGASAEAKEQFLAGILNKSGAKEGNDTVELMDPNNGMGLFVL